MKYAVKRNYCRNDRNEAKGMNRWIAGLTVFALLMVACATIETGNRMSLFDDTTRAYDSLIRWGSFEQAQGFKKLSETDANLPDFDGYRQIRITDYVAKQSIVSPDKSKVIRFVDIQYYQLRDVTIRNLSDRQIWEYDDQEDRWYLISDLPVFK
jgi:hypothetical protein